MLGSLFDFPILEQRENFAPKKYAFFFYLNFAVNCCVQKTQKLPSEKNRNSLKEKELENRTLKMVVVHGVGLWSDKYLVLGDGLKMITLRKLNGLGLS